MIPNDQDHREKAADKVIAQAAESLTRAQRATVRAEKAIQIALKAGRRAQQQLAGRKRGRA